MSPAIILSIVLVITGVGGYIATDMVSMTALIPAFFGAAIFAVQKLPKSGVISIVLAVLGMAGAGRGLPGLFTLISGGEVERPIAVILQGVMFFACLLFVVISLLKKKS